MLIRSHTWGAATISWAYVMERLLHAMEELGHESILVSTNGYAGSQYWSAEKARSRLAEFEQRGVSRFDIDITYAKPHLWRTRFLKDSKTKIARYDYETTRMPDGLSGFWDIPDYIGASSAYVADIFRASGCPEKRLTVIHNGVDNVKFNAQGPRVTLDQDRYFFLCVAEPHYRKQLDVLIDTYCRTFSSRDRTTLLIKTKLFDDVTVQRKKRFEMDLRPVYAAVRQRLGSRMPDIRFIPQHLDSLAPLYRACQCFVLPTAAEGWGMPFLEALACGNLVIAPDHGGQREFLTHENAILIPTGVRNARPEEQYYLPVHGSQAGAPNMQAFGEAMRSAYEDHGALLTAERAAAAQATARRFSWQAAAQQVLALAR